MLRNSQGQYFSLINENMTKKVLLYQNMKRNNKNLHCPRLSHNIQAKNYVNLKSMNSLFRKIVRSHAIYSKKSQLLQNNKARHANHHSMPNCNNHSPPVTLYQQVSKDKLTQRIIRDVRFGNKSKRKNKENLIVTPPYYSVNYKGIDPHIQRVNFGKQLSRFREKNKFFEQMLPTEVKDPRSCIEIKLNEPMTKLQIQSQFSNFMQKYKLDPRKLKKLLTKQQQDD